MSSVPGVGLVGAGEISRYHLDGLRAAGVCRLVAISARDTDQARAVAERYGVADVEEDWRHLVRRPDVDAVVVATPAVTHAEITLDAIAAGKAILVQKPMAPSAAEARKVLDVADAAGTLLSVSFMHRYFEEIAALRHLLEHGELGAVYAARIRNATPGPDWSASYYEHPASGGLHGVVAELGVHGIDLTGHLFGAVSSVAAQARQVHTERVLADGTRVRSEIDDHVVAIYETATGVSVSHEMDYAEIAGTDRFRLEVYGTAGVAVVRGSRGPLAIRRRGDESWYVPPLPASAFGERQHREFLAQVTGEAAPDTTARDAVAGLRIAEAVQEAAATGRRLEVTHP